MRILVIGGSGFIGTRLVDVLLDRGHSVSIYDIKTSLKYPSLTVEGDVRSIASLAKAMDGIEIVYNLAAEHSDDVSPKSLYTEVNINGAKNIVEAATQTGIKKIIFTSTVAIYGLNKVCPSEESPAEPFNEYGRTKWEAEKIFRNWQSANEERSLIIFRPAVVFGEGNRGNVYNLMVQIDSGRFIMIGNGKNRKSMGYVGNLSSILADQIDNKGLKTYNYCDKPDMSSREIADIIAKKLGVILPKYSIPMFIGLAAGLVFDTLALLSRRKFPISLVRIRKFAAETTIITDKVTSDGFVGPYSLEHGLQKMIEADFIQQKREV